MLRYVWSAWYWSNQLTSVCISATQEYPTLNMKTRPQNIWIQNTFICANKYESERTHLMRYANKITAVLTFHLNDERVVNESHIVSINPKIFSNLCLTLDFPRFFFIGQVLLTFANYGHSPKRNFSLPPKLNDRIIACISFLSHPTYHQTKSRVPTNNIWLMPST